MEAANQSSASTSANQQAASFELTHQMSEEDKEITAIIAKQSEADRSTAGEEMDSFASHSVAVSESTNQTAGSSKSTSQNPDADTNEPMKQLDVSEPQYTVLKSQEHSTEVVELDGVKINMDLKETGKVLLYSINPFVIPVDYLKPLHRI